MKFVQIGEHTYINVDAIVYIDRKNRIVRTNETGRNVYIIDEEWFDALMEEIL